jgi:hypothetical protein
MDERKEGDGITQPPREVPSDNVGLPFQQTVRRQHVKGKYCICPIPIRPRDSSYTHTHTHTNLDRQTDPVQFISFRTDLIPCVAHCSIGCVINSGTPRTGMLDVSAGTRQS